ncbi:MAG: serine hydrolase [Nitrolancea sp.]
MRSSYRVALCLLLMASLLPSSISADAPPATFDGLRSELNDLLSSWNGNYAVSVTDVQTGQTISINGDVEEPAASTIKIFVALAIAQQIDAGAIELDDVDDQMRLMMAVSDNEAAYELIELLGNGDIVAGTAYINTVAQALGATGTILDSPPDHPEIDLGVAADNLLTSNDLNMVLTKLYRGEILSPDGTDYVLELMNLPEDWQNGSVGGPLPDGATFYHKPGWLDDPYNTWNDAGIVVVKRNGESLAYAISYLSSFSDSEGQSYDNGYAVSQAVWDYFDAAYPLETSHFFVETDYAVSNGFLHYWQQNGGLEIFGYPISGEIDQNGATVQYFERARFEWHPGAAPDNYDVILGLLGDELTATRRASGEFQFQPTTPRDQDGCIYFDETHQNLCGGFVAYWEQFGGLALFGYPISSEFNEDGTTVQYFERARFEWHPGSDPEHFDVLLGRLGAEELTNQSH